MAIRAKAQPDRPGLVALTGRPADTAVGKVWLVGAGPGDPDLLTVKALRLLSGADVLVYDRLIPQAILNLAPAKARKLYVGKRKSAHSVPQGDLNDLLVALAREGLSVVRLKGGDPFVFGRGGEELLACRAAGIACEIVPGVSAALAASASLGAPLTHRGLAQTVSFVTGHAAPSDDGAGEPNLDWAALARPNHTVAVYMGLTTAETLAARLMAAGRAASTPVLIVQHASRPDQRQALTTLAGLADAARGFDAPSLLIIGEVAALADLDLAASVMAAGSPAQVQGQRA
jgi:uroporphyrin-III C-methyltransferase